MKNIYATCHGKDFLRHLTEIAKRIRPAIDLGCCIDDNACHHALRMARFIADNPIVVHEKATVVAAFYDIRSEVVGWM